MNMPSSLLRRDERAIFDLRTLYEQYGYQKYKMSKFEEYDLYSENKSFLKSKNIITFNDPTGRLLALKPDVTLSIAKNVKDDEPDPQRLYYNENVYRADERTHEIKEIMQVGLEYIGQVDLYTLCEVIALGWRSLKSISPNTILDLSHMGFVSGLLDSISWPYGVKEDVLGCIAKKNVHELRSLCQGAGVDEETTKRLASMATLYGPFAQTLEQARTLCREEAAQNALEELEAVYQVLDAMGATEGLNLDFSLVNDISYYNGIIFQGFIDGVPKAVLAGGRYDNLLHKLGKQAGAVGFAVYLDLLERYDAAEQHYDVDTLLLYDEDADVKSLAKAVDMLTQTGQRVRVQRQTSGNVRCRQLLRMRERGLEIVEKHD